MTNPHFSIITPVYNPTAEVLQATIDSVIAQTFTDWELILIDDCSPSPRVREQLRAAASADHRIVVVERSENGGISAASADGLAVARGEFVAMLDHDDEITSHALEHIVDYESRSPEMDYCYSDEDLLSDEGVRIYPFYKPDWSPERFRSQNYCCHFSVFRRSLLIEVGGFRPGFDGAQDYDVILRVTERARQIVHIPEVLYHWRQIATSTAGDPNSKPYAWDAGRRALQEHCDRVGIVATVEQQEPQGTYRILRRVAGDPLISIVIPTRGSVGRPWGMERAFVVEAINSIRSHTSRRVEFVVVVDTAAPAAVVAAIRRAAGDQLQLVWYDKPFNFSEKVNIGALHATGDLLLFLNDDVEVISNEFLDPMIPLALESDVGAVGAKLYFEDGRIQHVGHVYNHAPYHAFFQFPGWDVGPRGMLAVQRECIGVTAACMMTRPEIFHEVGGFSMKLPGNYNDVDFNLKLQQAGYRVLITPYTELYHFESATRNPTIGDEERQLIMARWAPQLARDPYYNVNLAPNRDDWVERGAR
jgi:O-antigen biosynthesis protein